MTSGKSPLPHEKDAAQPASKAGGREWQTRHERALHCPNTGFERALVFLVRGLESYATAHHEAYGSPIHDDGVLGVAWAQIGEGLLGLLSGERHRLDGGSLDRAIRDLLEPPFSQDVAVSEDTDDRADAPLLEVFAYSRANALADGVLIDVSDTAREAGFRLPVALTAALWADIHAIPERLQGAADPAGRLWDVLFVGRCALSRQRQGQTSCRYPLEMPVGEATRYEVKMCCGPGDAGEPVLTLMQTGED